jgi:hypothetical protein
MSTQLLIYTLMEFRQTDKLRSAKQGWVKSWFGCGSKLNFPAILAAKHAEKLKKLFQDNHD